jgi:predicted dehydrogenase
MYRENPRLNLVAGGDINAENLEAFAAKFEVPGKYLDYRQMLRDVRPDIVSIATGVLPHAEMILAACDAGVRLILCEKPFVASPAQLAAVRAAVARTGTKLAIAHVRRNRPAFMRARELYTSGAIGRPVVCVAGIKDWDLSEWGSHWLDMFRFFHDDQPVRWVFGQARVRGVRLYGKAMEEHAVAYFEFENGGRAMNGDATMRLVGTEGAIRVFKENKLVIDSPRGQKVEEFTDSASTSWQPLWGVALKQLVAWLDGALEPRIGFTYTANSAELNLAAYLSAARRDRIDLPLSEELNQIDEWPLEEIVRGPG